MGEVALASLNAGMMGQSASRSGQRGVSKDEKMCECGRDDDRDAESRGGKERKDACE